MHLQKELAELRKNQALAENMYIQERTCKGREIARTRGLSSNAEAEMERSAHLETMDALECSEASVSFLFYFFVVFFFQFSTSTFTCIVIFSVMIFS